LSQTHNKFKMIKNKKIYTKTALSILILILVSNSVFAFAVSSTYWEEKPIRMYPGETKEIKLTLQNMPGPNDLSALGEIFIGGDIAELTKKDKIYFVPFEGKTDVFIKISIPKEASIEDNYELGLTFTTISTEQANTLGFGQSIEKKIPIVIIEETKQPTNYSWLIYLIIAIIIVVIAIFVVKKKKEKPKKKS